MASGTTRFEHSFRRVITRNVQPLSPHPARAMDRIIEEVRRYTLPYVCNRAIKNLENIFNSLSMLKAAIQGLLLFKHMKMVFTDKFQYCSKTA